MFRYELKSQCVQWCQEHSRKYHKQELQNFMFPRCWLHCRVRLGSWHPRHMEKESRVPSSPAGLHMTRPASLFSLRGSDFGSKPFAGGDGIRAHTHAHTNCGETEKTQTRMEMTDPRITMFNQNTADGKTNTGEGFHNC